MRKPCFVVALALLAVACNPTAGGNLITSGDVPVGNDRPAAFDGGASDSGVPADVPIAPTACRSSRDCARGVCDRVTGVCAECVSGAQCGASAPVCRGGRCVDGTACASSRTCPGQVCDTALGRCVDCVTDPDCTDGRVCTRNSCLPPPTPCRSDRECGTLDQVCNAAQGVCVDCNTDVDCPSGQYCTPQRACVPQVCAPAARECADLRQLRACAANGSAWQESTCPSGTSCVDGQCRSRVCTPGTASCESAAQRQECNADGLGYTATACGPMETCAAGACRPWTCTPGATTCSSSTAVSVCNADGLGARTTTCPTTAGATGACVAGACQVTCVAGQADCDMVAANGCETATASDVRHCGGCGMACPARANSVPSCTAGRCAVVCQGGYGDCDGDPGNGCERALRTDIAHCGACNNACATGPNARASCASGACSTACESGYGNCDGLGGNGCEAALAADIDHCGGCGMRCAPLSATGACAAGRCTVAACNAGFADCDGSAATGCEVNLALATSHCGACGRACPGAGTTGTSVTCSAGTCTFACMAGYTDCDANPANGCEAHLASDARNCGACGTACASGQSCLGGSCSTTPPGSLALARYGLAGARATDGRVYAFGGTVGSTITANTEMFDPATNAWTARAPMPVARYLPAAAALADGRVLAIGGYNSTAAVGVYAYTPSTNTWATLPSLATARYGAAAAVGLDGRVFVFGGSANSSSLAMTSAAVFNPVTNAWSNIRSVGVVRTGGSAVTAPDGRIYLFGGTTTDGGSTLAVFVEIYDPATDTYTLGPNWSSARPMMGAAVGADGRVYLAGGYLSTYLTTVSTFTFATATFGTAAPMNVPHSYFPLVSLADGRLLAIGGRSTSALSTARVEAYDIGTNTWR